MKVSYSRQAIQVVRSAPRPRLNNTLDPEPELVATWIGRREAIPWLASSKDAVNNTRPPQTRPPQTDDGIATATPQDVGLDAAILGAMTGAILDGTYINVHSVLIARHDRLVYEKYFAGEDEVRMKGHVGRVDHDRDGLHDIRSITKSITGAAVLIAHALGKLPDLDASVLGYFPEIAAHDAGSKRPITIQHLLNMTAGLWWDERLNDAMKSGSATQAYDFILQQHMASEPGQEFSYRSSYLQLLAAIVERATGTRIEEFVRTHLFLPLGITEYEWNVEANGLACAWAGLRMRSRDLLKFGLLYRNDGRWQGKQVIPSHLVEQTLSEQVAIPFSDASSQVAYSNHFWIYKKRIGGEEVTYAQAQGNGDQMVAIVRADDLVLVATAGNYDKDVAKSSWDLFADFVHSAVVEKAT
jgi:CubicO group peptidase (beta-lactamase class C family)